MCVLSRHSGQLDKRLTGELSKSKSNNRKADESSDSGSFIANHLSFNIEELKKSKDPCESKSPEITLRRKAANFKDDPQKSGMNNFYSDDNQESHIDQRFNSTVDSTHIRKTNHMTVDVNALKNDIKKVWLI